MEKKRTKTFFRYDFEGWMADYMTGNKGRLEPKDEEAYLRGELVGIYYLSIKNGDHISLRELKIGTLYLKRRDSKMQSLLKVHPLKMKIPISVQKILDIQ